MGREGTKELADGVPKSIDGSGGSFAQERFEFREDLLDGIKIRAIRRKIENFCAGGFDSRLDARDLMRGQIVHHDDVTHAQGWGKTLFNPRQETFTVDRAVKDIGRDQFIVTQSSDEGRRFPMTVRDRLDQTFALKGATIAWSHVRFGPRFIEKYKLCGIKLFLKLAPRLAPLSHVGAFLLGCDQRFFYNCSRKPSKKKKWPSCLF